jgi:mannan endo-1,4-beta-mannosidase
MNMHHLLLILLISSNLLVSAQKFEAESAALSGSATKVTNAARSGGQYVAMNEGSLTFSISLGAEGYYDFFLTAAAPGGNKINVLNINGNSINFSTTGVNFETNKLVSGIKLSAGANSIKIQKSWGYIDIDYIQLQKVTASTRYDINPTLVTPQPNDGAARLYQFLYDNYGRKIISGAMTLNSFDETEWLKANTGKEPALIGLDFMHSGRGYSWYNDKEPIEDARDYYNRNGIPAFCWHWRDPSRQTDKFYSNETNFDITKVFDPSSSEYQAMIADIDYISGLLLELQEENIPVIWRPLHEAAGGWFWWGAKGAAPCKKLYQIMYDRMVNFHGLKNLIWVWTREPNDDDWYPGDEYIDIIGRDIYKEGDHTSQVLEWGDMNERYGKKKMVTISECGSFPDVDNLIKDGAAWSYFMPWYGGFVRDSKHNSLSLWKKMFAHDYVLTLDEMPDLRTYEAVEPEPEPDPVTALYQDEKKSIIIFPTRVESNLFIEAKYNLEKIEILDVMGNVILVEHVSENTVTISMSSMRSGIYLIRVNETIMRKVVKL